MNLGNGKTAIFRRLRRRVDFQDPIEIGPAPLSRPLPEKALESRAVPRYCIWQRALRFYPLGTPKNKRWQKRRQAVFHYSLIRGVRSLQRE